MNITNKNTKKIFIGMPVYNGERFLGEAIESIINQSFTDWTLYISDDGSTDNTSSICLKYMEKDSRITYHRQEKNLGMFANFKFTMDTMGDEDYFMWAAQDDIREESYLETCINALDSNHRPGLAASTIGAIDSFGRTLTEEKELINFSDKSILSNVVRYVLQPEILGKCNLMYGLWRADVVREVWRAYPQRNVWGQDYIFSLALIARFPVYVSQEVLFKKRFGGWSNPGGLKEDDEDLVKTIEYKHPKNHMFPFGRFNQYLGGHMEALSGTPYRLLAIILLFARLPRALLIHIRERSLKNFIKKKILKINK